MSTTDLYVLNGKSTTWVAEFRNGWGSAPLAWAFLGDKYVPETPIYSLSESHLKKVWALAQDKRLLFHERVALMFTFDRAYIPLDRLEEAGTALFTFGTDCENGKSVNHWPAIGTKLRELAKQKYSRHARGIVISPTSVSDNWQTPSKNWLENAWSIFD